MRASCSSALKTVAFCRNPLLIHVRTLLNYCSPLFTAANKNKLEAVQCNFTKNICELLQ
jgi:hypothetical protein